MHRSKDVTKRGCVCVYWGQGLEGVGVERETCQEGARRGKKGQEGRGTSLQPVRKTDDLERRSEKSELRQATEEG